MGRGGAGEQALGIAGSDGRARAMPQREVGYPADLLLPPWGWTLGRQVSGEGPRAGGWQRPPEGEACFAGLLPAAELWFRVGVTTLGWAPLTSSPAAPQSGQALVTDVPSQLSSPRPRPPRPPGSGQSPLVPDDLSWLSHFPSEPGAHLPLLQLGQLSALSALQRPSFPAACFSSGQGGPATREFSSLPAPTSIFIGETKV